MATTCTGDNFEDTTTTLQWGRPVTNSVLDNTALASSDGTFSGNHAGTVMVTQDVTWNNTTGMPLLVTPVFFRPSRFLRTNDPQRAWLRERWAATTGAAPAVPTLPTDITHFGGGTEGVGAWRYTDLRQAAACYAPLGQFTVPTGQGLRVSYQCRLFTEQPIGWTGSGRLVYARGHRIVYLADLTTDPAV